MELLIVLRLSNWFLELQCKLVIVPVPFENVVTNAGMALSLLGKALKFLLSFTETTSSKSFAVIAFDSYSVHLFLE